MAVLLAAGGSGFVFIVYIAVIVLVFAGLWHVFVKAGRPGWEGIIPIYNYYVVLKIVGRPGWWLILYFIPIVNLIITDRRDASTWRSRYGKSIGFAVGLILLAVHLHPDPGLRRGELRRPGRGGSQGDVIMSTGAEGALADRCETMSMPDGSPGGCRVASTTVLAMWSARHFRSRPDAMRTNETTSVMMPKIPVTMPPMTSRSTIRHQPALCPVSGCHVRMPSTCSARASALAPTRSLPRSRSRYRASRWSGGWPRTKSRCAVRPWPARCLREG